MSKKYTKMFTGLGYPANPALPVVALPQITISAGKLKCVTVPFPSEGRLASVVVGQVNLPTSSPAGTDTPVNFTVKVMAGAAPYPADQEQTIPFAPLANDEMFTIPADNNTGIAGTTLELITAEQGYQFVNLDGTPTNNIRKIYLVIIPTGAVQTTTWEAKLTCETDVG